MLQLGNLLFADRICVVVPSASSCHKRNASFLSRSLRRFSYVVQQREATKGRSVLVNNS
jgi:hypothetical protein